MLRRLHTFEQYPLHVAGKCPWTVWPVSLESAWESFCSIIDRFQQEYPVQTHAFVMMSNHYHWLGIYDDIETDKALFERLHAALSLEISAQLTTLDHIEAYRNSYRYIYRNPVEAGLVRSAQEYRYSTLPHILGQAPLNFLCLDYMSLIRDPRKTLEFINRNE